MSEDANAIAIRKGNQAEQELTLTNGFFDELKAGIVARIILSQAGSHPEREGYCSTLKVIEAVRGSLKQAISDGANAQAHSQAIKDAIAKVGGGS